MFQTGRGMEMPQTHDSDTASVFHHIEAVILAQHRLMMKLKQISKSSDAPDDRNFKLARLLSKHLAKESARLERIAARLETQFIRSMRKRLH
jgi:hypothetical protein